MLTIVDAEILKNVVQHSVATAFAIIVFPVPGGPKRRIPFQGSRRPVKYWGYLSGRRTASFMSLFGALRPIMSLNQMLGF